MMIDMKKLFLTLFFLSIIANLSKADNSEQGFINVPGGPVWYKVSGNGKGLPLITLHGGPGSTSCTYSLLEPLGDQRPIIRYDQLGSGRSGRPDDLSLWKVDRFIEELHVIRQELNLDQFHLLGHSWGAALAGAYLLEKGTKHVARKVGEETVELILDLDNKERLKNEFADLLYHMLVLLKSKNINLSEIDNVLKERSTRTK